MDSSDSDSDSQTEIRQVLDVTKIEQWQPLVTKIKFPFLVSKIPPIPFCTVDRRSRNKFRRGVKSTKFAIADCGSEEEKTKFYRNLSHTSRNYGLEISYGSHSKLWDTRTPQLAPILNSCACNTPVNPNSPILELSLHSAARRT